MEASGKISFRILVYRDYTDNEEFVDLPVGGRTTSLESRRASECRWLAVVWSGGLRGRSYSSSECFSAVVVDDDDDIVITSISSWK